MSTGNTVQSAWVRGGCAGLVLLAVLWTGTTQSDDGADSALAQALISVEDADPLELARIAAGADEEAVLALLGEDTPPDIRLAAIRSTPWLRSPERALLTLAEMGNGTDPDLAPAAIVATYRIAVELEADAVVSRESALDGSPEVLSSLRRLANDGEARMDLRRLAQFSIAELEDLKADRPAETPSRAP